MRQLAAQLAEAERVAHEAEATLASRTEGVSRAPTGHENNNKNKSKMLSDMHGRHHNYLRISLTERCVGHCFVRRLGIVSFCLLMQQVYPSFEHAEQGNTFPPLMDGFETCCGADMAGQFTLQRGLKYRNLFL